MSHSAAGTGGGGKFVCNCASLVCPICHPPHNWVNPTPPSTGDWHNPIGPVNPLTPTPNTGIIQFHPITPQQGWECPRCTRIYGPYAMECHACNQFVNLMGPKK